MRLFVKALVRTGVSRGYLAKVMILSFAVGAAAAVPFAACSPKRPAKASAPVAPGQGSAAAGVTAR